MGSRARGGYANNEVHRVRAVIRWLPGELYHNADGKVAGVTAQFGLVVGGLGLP
jgi:hypothetical protein